MDFQEYPDEYAAPARLYKCPTCARSFNEKALQKHKTICAKNASKGDRKVFNMKEQRAEGTDINTVKKSPASTVSYSRKTPGSSSNSRNNANNIRNSKPITSSSSSSTAVPEWKKKSEDFRAQLRHARRIKQAEDRGDHEMIATLVANQPKQMVEDTRQQCQYCNRRFAEESYDRHVKFCETQAKKVKRIVTDDKINDKNKMNKRLTYKPPKLGLKKTPSSTNMRANATSSGYGNFNSGQRNVDSPPSVNPRANLAKKNSATALNNIDNELKNLKIGMGSAKGRAFGSGFGTNKQNKKMNPQPASAQRKSGGTNSRFGHCHDCRTEYPVDWAKFCSFCGVRKR